MPILPVYGHDSLRQRFAQAIARGTMPASLLLAGPRGVGKQRLALWVAQALVCDAPASDGGPCGKCQQCRYSLELTHPDLHWVFPRPRLKDGDAGHAEVRADYAEAIAERVKAHGIYPPPAGTEGIYVATVRAVVQTAAMSPAMAHRKVIVVGDAERMVPQEGAEAAANAFLKLLEEPPADTTIIITSSEPGALLPTIRSRVVSVRVAPLTESDTGAFLADPAVHRRLDDDKTEGSTDELVRASGGAPGRLFGAEAWSAALQHARRLIDAAVAPDPALRYRAALGQGASGARGKFTDTLDALTVLLHDRARASAERADAAGAMAASQAIEAVERAKELAGGNVNPQLLGASLLRDMSALLR